MEDHNPIFMSPGMSGSSLSGNIDLAMCGRAGGEEPRRGFSSASSLLKSKNEHESLPLPPPSSIASYDPYHKDTKKVSQSQNIYQRHSKRNLEYEIETSISFNPISNNNNSYNENENECDIIGNCGSCANSNNHVSDVIDEEDDDHMSQTQEAPDNSCTDFNSQDNKNKNIQQPSKIENSSSIQTIDMEENSKTSIQGMEKSFNNKSSASFDRSSSIKSSNDDENISKIQKKQKPSLKENNDNVDTSVTKLYMSGVQVTFPSNKKAFPSQLQLMHAVIGSLQKGQHALLESPTGTGKTLALLLSTLGWQRHDFNERYKKYLELQQINLNVDDKGNEKEKSSSSSLSPPGEEQTIGNAANSRDSSPNSTSNVVKSRHFQNASNNNSEGESTPIGKKTKPNANPSYSDDFEITPKQDKLPISKEMDEDKKEQKEKGPKLVVPQPVRVFYASRTHSQIAQVAKELKALPASCREGPEKGRPVRATTLGSRNHLCVNPKIMKKKKADKEEECQKLLTNNAKGMSDSAQVCNYFRNKDRLKSRVISLFSKTQEELESTYSATETAAATASSSSSSLYDTSHSYDYYTKASKRGRQGNLLNHFVDAGSKKKDCILDIEDLIQFGKESKGCPFFVSRDLVTFADLIFCPYNYLLDPVISKSIGITEFLEGSVIVIDEAHNIEDVCRDAASCDIDFYALYICRDELANFFKIDPEGVGGGKKSSLIQLEIIHPGCSDKILEMSKMMNSLVNFIVEVSVSRGDVTWSGPEAIALISEACSIDIENFIRLVDFISEISSDVQETPTEISPGMAMSSRSDKIMISKITRTTLEMLKKCFDYMTSNSAQYLRDFRVLLWERNDRKGLFKLSMNSRWSMSEADKVQCCLSIWCMNPAVAFKRLESKVRSIILTSGTLSPMSSFSTELDTTFPKVLEATHVIDPKTQVWIGAATQGPNGVFLDGTYKSTETPYYQDDLGLSVVEYCKTIPDGILCFFPSYSLLDRCVKRWKDTGVWSEIERAKPGGIFVEFGKSSTSELLKNDNEVDENFERVVLQYRTAIASNRGALFLCVFRGKLSEGINFADKDARGVLIVGIPFPSIYDMKIKLKKQYQDDRLRSGITNLSGSAWYNLQAYRALNQAIGRCIRHRNDYGAIILIDSRYEDIEKISNLSKWLRPHVKIGFASHKNVSDSVQHFFTNVVPNSLKKPFAISLDDENKSGFAVQQKKQDIEISDEEQHEEEVEIVPKNSIRTYFTEKKEEVTNTNANASMQTHTQTQAQTMINVNESNSKQETEPDVKVVDLPQHIAQWVAKASPSEIVLLVEHIKKRKHEFMSKGPE